MGLNRKFTTIFSLLGSLLLILGIIILLPIVLVFFYQEGSLLYKSFLIPALISLSLGVILIQVSQGEKRLDLTTSMVVCGLGWILSSAIGALPFQISLNKSFIDAYFEAVSGFTTTGITLFQGLENMPKSIIFWRSLIQWLGGLGIITFFLVVTFRSEGGVWQLFTAESHKISTSRPVPNVLKTIKILWMIYIGFTVLEILLLILFQVSVYDAVIHSLTTLSTGGFSNYDSSIGHFQQIGHPFYKVIEYIIIFFMILGGVNFLVHFKVLTGNIKEMFTNVELKHFWGIIIGSVSLILLGRIMVNGGLELAQLESDFRTTLFQVVSVITTTGYGTQSIGSAFFPAVAKQLFLFLMLVGGCVGSTSGGLKVIRIAILNKLFTREIKKIYLPKRAVLPVKLNKKIINDEEIMKIGALFFGWLALILIGGGVTALFSDLSAFQSISGMFSAVGNIGPFYFSVAKMASLSPVIKLTYILGMLAGRLEILPIFILFTKQAWK
ncbi:TrkH family potassium uptake protein [Selenihalanaerobacter shriftii]|uniref:Trk system potassium uptake protein TrkH n=1 Tax=Selenihalanaerobacter shriftii TaxID=142842 RepID=A0A1T4PPP4_9FIRM|nr:TrkH family potassium uptake protein [Selenihalanaerobacter shriftii]SJZ93226.1 trk system potassium uptake protein TrkH [Selenihalanaerobacter shriftii]